MDKDDYIKILKRALVLAVYDMSNTQDTINFVCTGKQPTDQQRIQQAEKRYEYYIKKAKKEVISTDEN